MSRAYVEYQKDSREHVLRIFGLIFWWFLAAVFLIFTVAALVAAMPLGVIFAIPCSLFLWFVIRKSKRCAQVGKRLRAYRAVHKPSPFIWADTTYCFVAPFSSQEAIYKICMALRGVGEVNNVELDHGIIYGKIWVSAVEMKPVTIYVERGKRKCKVRACFRTTANDDWWDEFLISLFESNPGVNFGVSLANGSPVIAGVLNLQGDVRQVSVSHTSGGTSLTGFLVGGALFGDAGAVVGGLSGRERTVTDSRTVFSNELLVRVIYSNGRLWEGTVKKGSKLYNEILVNMK